MERGGRSHPRGTNRIDPLHSTADDDLDQVELVETS